MQIKPIHDENDYRDALRRIEGLMGAEPGTPEGDLLDVWVTLVEAYERNMYPPASPHLIRHVAHLPE
ncbi:hypothetical protein LJC22_05430 [Desulfosarcina sp. OttesenSCG-928-G10]|nr:hypothetical protein [Desulfosarcina sp. OttesenSCG-928-G10]MDL2322161.1 hypothetical protein [Desulfosarcina sp. OttesenSCG-928-B08]